MPHLLPAKYKPNWPGGSGERVILMVLTIYGRGGHPEFRIKTVLAIFRSPNFWKLHMKFGYILLIGFREEVV